MLAVKSLLLIIISLFLTCCRTVPSSIPLCSQLDDKHYLWLTTHLNFRDNFNNEYLHSPKFIESVPLKNGSWHFKTSTSGYLFHKQNLYYFTSLKELSQLDELNPVNVIQIVKNALEETGSVSISWNSLVGVNARDSTFYFDRFKQDISMQMAEKTPSILSNKFQRNLLSMTIDPQNFELKPDVTSIIPASSHLSKWVIDANAEHIFSIEFNNSGNKKLFVQLDAHTAIKLAPEVLIEGGFVPIKIKDKTYFVNKLGDDLTLTEYINSSPHSISSNHGANVMNIGRVKSHIWFANNRDLFVYNPNINDIDHELSGHYNALSIRTIFSPYPDKYIARADKPKGDFVYYDLDHLTRPNAVCKTQPVIITAPKISHHTFEQDGKMLHYTTKTRNNNKVLIYLHGGPNATTGYEFHMMDRFLDSNYDIVHVNYPGSTGFGIEYLNSGKLKDAKETISSIESFLQSSSLKKYDERILVGQSYGAYLGYFLSKNQKNRLSSSHLINGVYSVQARVEALQKGFSLYKRVYKFIPDLAVLNDFIYDPNLDPIKRVHNFANPVYFYVDKNDAVVSYVDGKAFYQSIKDKYAGSVRYLNIGGHVPNTMLQWDILKNNLAANLK